MRGKVRLFNQPVGGVKTLENLYYLIETAKSHGLEPCDYLRDVFTKIPLSDTGDDIDALLSGNTNAQKINLL